jgi:hypothetical protein
MSTLTLAKHISSYITLPTGVESKNDIGAVDRWISNAKKMAQFTANLSRLKSSMNHALHAMHDSSQQQSELMQI